MSFDWFRFESSQSIKGWNSHGTIDKTQTRDITQGEGVYIELPQPIPFISVVAFTVCILRIYVIIDVLDLTDVLIAHGSPVLCGEE